MKISDEAVEAATEAMFDVFTGENENADVYVQENSPTRWVVDGIVNLPYLINRILEAAAPYMQAAALEAAAKTFSACSPEGEYASTPIQVITWLQEQAETIRAIPYRSQA